MGAANHGMTDYVYPLYFLICIYRRGSANQVFLAMRIFLLKDFKRAFQGLLNYAVLFRSLATPLTWKHLEIYSPLGDIQTL